MLLAVEIVWIDTAVVNVAAHATGSLVGIPFEAVVIHIANDAVDVERVTMLPFLQMLSVMFTPMLMLLLLLHMLLLLLDDYLASRFVILFGVMMRMTSFPICCAVLKSLSYVRKRIPEKVIVYHI